MRTSVARVATTLFAGLLGATAGATSIPFPDLVWGGGSSGIARVAFDIAGLGDDEAVAATTMSDGRLVMAGSAETAANSTDGAFVRLDALTGLPDPSFGPNHDGRARLNIPASSILDVRATADGKVLYVGTASSNAMIGRLLGDGTPDNAFDADGHRFIGAMAFIDGSTTVNFQRVLALPDGRIVAAGYVTTPIGSSGAYHGCVMRFDADGSTDTSFGAGAGYVCFAPVTAADAFFAPIDMVRQSDERLLLAGAALHSGGSGLDMAVARLSADGALDATFGPGHDGWAYVAFDQGQSLSELAQAIAIDASGRLVLAGYFENVLSTDIGIARLSATGDLDASFGTQGRVQIALDLGGYSWDVAHSVALRPDGGILIGAESQVNATVGVAILLKPDGALDAHFGTQGVFVQADPAGPASGIVDSRRQLLSGDYIYMVGDLYDPSLAAGMRGDQSDSTKSRGAFDFAATRFVLPLFADGFDANP